MSSVPPEQVDAGLLALARSARGRTRAAEGAAVRDAAGDAYAAASVCLPSLAITALQLAVATAVTAGASRLTGAVVVTEASTLDGAGHAAFRDLAGAVPVVVASPDGVVLGRVTA
ncbi:cytidine deaminase [Pilimelia columellifera]|uniref:Cytidine deaminase n=1 Tax=Pilimelia columellifera subsp. columellifera TaxID=706583 RepID=A0ABN3NNN3_9ACTN